MALCGYRGEAIYDSLVQPLYNRPPRWTCGLKTVSRKSEAGEYLPSARVTVEPPPAVLYRLCPRCLPALNLPQEGPSDC